MESGTESGTEVDSMGMLRLLTSATVHVSWVIAGECFRCVIEDEAVRAVEHVRGTLVALDESENNKSYKYRLKSPDKS